jgi:hypothetical protein
MKIIQIICLRDRPPCNSWMCCCPHPTRRHRGAVVRCLYWHQSRSRCHVDMNDQFDTLLGRLKLTYQTRRPVLHRFNMV